jgi:hypothetical protein
MILQYRFPFDVPELGASAGESVVIDVVAREIEIARDVTSDEAFRLVATLIPRLQPMHAPVPAHTASVFVAALADVPGRRRSRRPHLRVSEGGA